MCCHICIARRPRRWVSGRLSTATRGLFTRLHPLTSRLVFRDGAAIGISASVLVWTGLCGDKLLDRRIYSPSTLPPSPFLRRTSTNLGLRQPPRFQTFAPQVSSPISTMCPSTTAPSTSPSLATLAPQPITRRGTMPSLVRRRSLVRVQWWSRLRSTLPCLCMRRMFSRG